MNRHKRYPPEVRERAVRLVLEHQENYHSQWAALMNRSGNPGAIHLRQLFLESINDNNARNHQY